MSGFNVNNFLSKISDRKGLMRSNRFLVTMAPPPVMGGEYENEFRDLEFWCESTTLPGYMIGAYDHRRYTYGPIEKRPVTPMFQPIQCVFNSDGNADYVNFFNKWLQYIIPHDWYNSFNQVSSYNGSMYEVEYKLNYCTDINIMVFDSSGGNTEKDEYNVVKGGNEIPILHYIIKEAFPSQIYDIPFNWNDNENTRFQVNFDYIDWVEINDAAKNNTSNAGTPFVPTKRFTPTKPTEFRDRPPLEDFSNRGESVYNPGA